MYALQRQFLYHRFCIWVNRFQYRKRYVRVATQWARTQRRLAEEKVSIPQAVWPSCNKKSLRFAFPCVTGFNTASVQLTEWALLRGTARAVSIPQAVFTRCNMWNALIECVAAKCFNTASGIYALQLFMASINAWDERPSFNTASGIYALQQRVWKPAPRQG